jgi:hypothetical protein
VTPEEMEDMRASLPNLPPTRRRAKLTTPNPDNVAKGKWARRRGASGEREVVKRYSAHGYTYAHRQPMSGGMRVYGAQDTSPWPGDIGGVEPWLVEVKRSKYVDTPVRSGWPGQGFIRPVLRDLASLWRQHQYVGGTPTRPVLWARGDRGDWRLWIPERIAMDSMIGGTHIPQTNAWVEITEGDYWHHFGKDDAVMEVPDTLLQDSEIPGDSVKLWVVLSQEPSLTQTEMAKRLGTTYGAARRALQLLLNKGWVEVSGPLNKRTFTVITPTEAQLHVVSE